MEVTDLALKRKISYELLNGFQYLTPHLSQLTVQMVPSYVYGKHVQ
jgi:hypothetical protein